MQIAKINKDFPAVCLLILAMCASMQLYFTWRLPESIVYLACAMVLLFYFFKMKFTLRSLGMIFLLVVCYMYNYAHITAAFCFALFIHLNELYAKLISKFINIPFHNKATCSPWHIEFVDTNAQLLFVPWIYFCALINQHEM